ncbi:hypothetical protein [uncultured Nostoc sp.]|uniref:hypothetical protein n=1 Tax=uncultured Nostoc sp. TaxID=340711 RepID=UPI00260B4D2F|nr:hypothetical protein [uncultured Nostoc sp.]
MAVFDPYYLILCEKSGLRRGALSQDEIDSLMQVCFSKRTPAGFRDAIFLEETSSGFLFILVISNGTGQRIKNGAI